MLYNNPFGRALRNVNELISLCIFDNPQPLQDGLLLYMMTQPHWSIRPHKTRLLYTNFRVVRYGISASSMTNLVLELCVTDPRATLTVVDENAGEHHSCPRH